MAIVISERAYSRLIEPHRAELRAHCRRMLGSAADAEDAVQDTLVSAWMALPSFEGRGSLRSWLYRIATNASLDLMARRRPRAVPIEYDALAAPQDDGRGWVHVRDRGPEPDIRYEQRESLQRAFDVARRLPPNQRAVLILREVLGYSAAETAEMLDTSVAAVNSALQRARKALEEMGPAADRDPAPVPG